MKLKDFFKRCVEQGKISNPEFNTFIESLNDGEMPDALVPEFENHFFTLERAQSHPEVNKRLRAKILDPVEEKVQQMLEIIDKIDPHTALRLSAITRTTDSGKRLPDTYAILDGIRDAFPELIKKQAKAGSSDEELKKQLTSKDQTISELTEKFKKVESDFASEKKTLQTEYEGKLNTYQLDTELEKIANSYTFAEHFEPVKGVLTKAEIDKLKASNVLKLVENNGQREVQVFTAGADGQPVPKFNGNSPVTIKNLLDDSFKGYIKQSNADAGKGQQQVTKREFSTPDKNPAMRTPRSTAVE